MNRTEQRNPETTHIDTETTIGMLGLIQNENLNAVRAVGNALPAIAKACDAICERMKCGGRLIYIGAGSSGRIGILDAAECPPTFGVSSDTVIGLIAGGRDSMFRAAENAEDDGSSGVNDLKALDISVTDSVVGISAAGNAAYPAEALKYAKAIGCLTIGITANYGSRLDREPDISIVADTGPEAITGSTRMKAGSAQKMITNMISTTVMIKLGYVYENLMINLKPSNNKLRRRCVSIVSEINGCTDDESEVMLERNGWSIRAAVGSCSDKIDERK